MRLAVPPFAVPGKTSRPPDFPARGRTGKAGRAAAPGGYAIEGKRFPPRHGG